MIACAAAPAPHPGSFAKVRYRGLYKIAGGRTAAGQWPTVPRARAIAALRGVVRPRQSKGGQPRPAVKLDRILSRTNSKLPQPRSVSTNSNSSTSDHRTQYTTQEFQRRLANRGILCSMSRRGDCWDDTALEKPSLGAENRTAEPRSAYRRYRLWLDKSTLSSMPEEML